MGYVIDSYFNQIIELNKEIKKLKKEIRLSYKRGYIKGYKEGLDNNGQSMTTLSESKNNW